MQEIIKNIKESIEKAKSIVILSHIGSDGDSIGSTLSMQYMLKQFKHLKKIDSVIVGKIPDILAFLPDVDTIKNSRDSDVYQNYDLAIALDCGAEDRLGEAKNLFRNARNTISIDHHISNPNFAKINLVDETASATGEILFQLLEPLSLDLTKDIALCLYTAIITDTGCFKFDKTSPRTFEVSAELIRTGISPGYVQKQYYESKPLPMFKIHSKALYETKFAFNNRVAYTVVTRDMLNDSGANEDHIEGIVENLRTIKDVQVAMVFKETPRLITKVSFRSNLTDVCEIASFFGGGGHVLAAGCNIEKNPYDAVDEVLEIVKKRLLPTKNVKARL